jgi:hypothetical protein
MVCDIACKGGFKMSNVIIWDVVIKAQLEYDAGESPQKEELEEELDGLITGWVNEKGYRGADTGEAIPNLLNINVESVGKLLGD